ncbi:MAG: hypothetical protein KF760_35170 [Candidatus Eremiobacteraeota bacterium]|nr:hypothetical protein [Candidatus Eremiobacteraeota bacterium]MCW5870215.1 hypothetical protein [Candidatus Eremiobacteraeota bacterium]
MIGRMFMLAAMMKGVQSYQKPLFWAVIYLLYLLGGEHLFDLMLGHWQAPLWKSALGFAVSYATFWVMKESQDGPIYWAFFASGFLIMTVLLP